MCNEMSKKSLFQALLVLAVFVVGFEQAFGAVITTDVTWTTGNEITDGETITINNGATVIVDANMTDSSKVLDTLILGKTTTTPSASGTGAMEVTDQGELRLEKLEIGGENDGFLTIAENAFFFVEDEIVFNRGTITNHTAQNWSTRTITWNGSVIFQGSGSINLGSKASGETLEIADGTLTTSGNLDANNYTLTGGVLQVGGVLTLDQVLTDGGTQIELLTDASWRLDQDQTAGHIIVSGGTLDVEVPLDYSSTTGSLSMSDGTINLNDNDLNLGDADRFDITGGSFVSGSLGGSTISWNNGTLKAAYNTFFSTYHVDNVNVDLSDNAVLEIYDNGSGAYSVVYDFSLTDHATVTGTDMLLYVQTGGVINTDGVNTARFEFMGRNEKSITIQNGEFRGDIRISNGVLNRIEGGVFEAAVLIDNAGDTSTGVEDVPVGVGRTVISGGTFNDTVTLDLSRIDEEEEDDEDDENEDEQNKVTITAGTFNDTLLFTGAGNALISGGSFDSIELTSPATGTLTIGTNITVSGTDGVVIEGGKMTINMNRSLTVTNGLTMQGTGGTLTGNGTLIGNLNMESGILGGNLRIDGNVTQTGGQIAPGYSIGKIEITGSLELADVEIEIGENGLCDQIVATGAITTSDDGTMTIKTIDDDIQYHDGAKFTALESTAGTITIDPDYTIASDISGFDILGEVVTQGAGQAYVITLNRSIHTFPTGARNANNFVDYLYDLSYEGKPQDKVMKAIASDTNQQLAAETLSGESHLTGLQALMNVGMLRTHTLTEQIRPSMSSRFFASTQANSDEVVSRSAV